MAYKSIVRYIILTVIVGFLLIFSCADNSDSLLEDTLINEFVSQDSSYSFAPSGYYYAIRDTGSVDDNGNVESPNFSSTVILRYEMFLLDSTLIDSVEEALTIDLDLLLQGIQLGLTNVGRGGEISLLLPSSLAFGEIGDSRVDPNTPLRIELSLIEHFTSLSEYHERLILSYISDIGEDTLFVDEVYYSVQDTGVSTSISLIDTITISYRGYFLTGENFETVEDTLVELSNSIEAWQKVLPLFNVGGVGSIYAPSESAYGAQGTDAVPPDTPVLFDFEISAVQ